MSGKSQVLTRECGGQSAQAPQHVCRLIKSCQLKRTISADGRRMAESCWRFDISSNEANRLGGGANHKIVLNLVTLYLHYRDKEIVVFPPPSVCGVGL